MTLSLLRGEESAAEDVRNALQMALAERDLPDVAISREARQAFDAIAERLKSAEAKLAGEQDALKVAAKLLADVDLERKLLVDALREMHDVVVGISAEPVHLRVLWGTRGYAVERRYTRRYLTTESWPEAIALAHELRALDAVLTPVTPRAATGAGA